MNRRVEFEITREKKEVTMITIPSQLTTGAAPSSPPKPDNSAPVDNSKKANEPSKRPQTKDNDEDPESRALPMNEEHPESEGTQ
jgi:hypothetical protein